MNTTARLFEVVALLRPLVENIGVRKALPRVLLIVGIGVASMIFGTLLVLGLLYAGYLALTGYAFTPLQSVLILLGILAVILVALLLTLRRQLRALKTVSRPPLSKVTGIFDAFMEGYKKSAE